MKAWWQRVAARYVALSQRERVLVALALVLGPLLIGNSLFIERFALQRKALEAGVARHSATISELQTRVAVLTQQLQADPDAGPKAELAGLQAEQE